MTVQEQMDYIESFVEAWYWSELRAELEELVELVREEERAKQALLRAIISSPGC